MLSRRVEFEEKELMVQLPKKPEKNCNFVAPPALVYEARQCNCLFMVIYYQHILRVHCRKRDALLLNSIWQFQQPCFGKTIKTLGSLLKRVYGLWKHRRLDAFKREPPSLRVVSLLFASMNQRSSEKQKNSPIHSPQREFINSEDWKEIIQRSFLQQSSNEVINKEKYKRETGEVV